MVRIVKRLFLFSIVRVANVIGDLVIFQTAKVNFYGNNYNDDSNIGTETTNQRVALQRVPNYDDLTVTGTLNASTWDDLAQGVLVFKVLGPLSGSSCGCFGSSLTWIVS